MKVDCNHQHFCGAAAGASDIPPRPPTHMPVSLPSNTIRRLRSSFLCIGELCCAGHAGTRRLKRGLCRGSNVIIYWFMESTCGALVMITRRGVGCNCGGGGAAASKQKQTKCYSSAYDVTYSRITVCSSVNFRTEFLFTDETVTCHRKNIKKRCASARDHRRDVHVAECCQQQQPGAPLLLPCAPTCVYVVAVLGSSRIPASQHAHNWHFVLAIILALCSSYHAAAS